MSTPGKAAPEGLPDGPGNAVLVIPAGGPRRAGHPARQPAGEAAPTGTS